MNDDIWTRALAGIKDRIGRQKFDLWFRRTRLVEANSQSIRIGVPNLFIKGWMEERFSEPVRDALRDVCDWDGQVAFVVAKDVFPDVRGEQLAARADASKSVGAVQAPREPKMNPRMSLDEFVVGGCNQLAYAAATDVCFQPEPPFNRLFIYGGVGLGKTHLLNGLWQKLACQGLDGEAVFTTAEKWTNQYIYAITSNGLAAFRKKYRTVKFLLIDDVHFLKSKKGIQEEFLHTFDALDSANKRIVLASDSHPRDLEEVTANLINRFLSGMVAKIEAPDFQTRVRILRKKIERTRHRFPQEVIEFMADRITSNVRELEGALTTVVAYASLKRTPITVDLAAESLAEMVKGPHSLVTIRDIEDEVVRTFGFSRSDLPTRRRTWALCRARHVCMYLARELTHQSCHDIGRYFGDLKHTTVLSACKKMDERLRHDPGLARAVERIRKNLGQ